MSQNASLNPASDAPDAADIFANVPVALLLISNDGTIADANVSAEALLGQSAKRMKGHRVEQLFSFKNPRLQEALQQNAISLSAHDMEIHFPGGDRKVVDVAISSLDRWPGWALVSLSERVQHRMPITHALPPTEQISLGAPAVLSHEIKNPLAGIRGAAQLLARSVGANERPMIDLIVREVDRIARILDQIQHLGSKTAADCKPTNIHTTLDKAIQTVRAANAACPEIQLNFDPSLPDVSIDRDAMVQILINLLQNASDALADTEDALITVGTRFVMSGSMVSETLSGPGRSIARLPVELSITDNGPGVPDHLAAEIFSPFVSGKREGQGLGLAIVRKLIRDMGGRVVHERDFERGLTHFRLMLPLAVGEKNG